MLATDWIAVCTGIGVIITAVLGGIATIIGARNSGKVNDVHAAVTTPPNTATIGQLVADGVDGVNEIKEAVTGNTPPAGTPEVKP